jgi:hypothetical protein
MVDWTGFVNSAASIKNMENADRNRQETLALDREKEAARQREFAVSFADQHERLGLETQAAKQRLAIGQLELARAGSASAQAAFEADVMAKTEEAKMAVSEINEVRSTRDFLSKALPQKQAHDKALASVATGNAVSGILALDEYANLYTPEFSEANTKANALFAKKAKGALPGYAQVHELSAALDERFGKFKTTIREPKISETQYEPSAQPDPADRQSFKKVEYDTQSWSLSDVRKKLQAGTLEEKREAVRILSSFSNTPADKEALIAMVNKMATGADASELRLDRIDPSLDTPRLSILKTYDEAVKSGKMITESVFDPRTGMTIPVQMAPRAWLAAKSKEESPATQAAINIAMEPTKTSLDNADEKFNASVQKLVTNISELPEANQREAVMSLVRNSRNPNLTDAARMTARSAAVELGVDQATLDQSGGVEEDWNTSLGVPMLLVGGGAGALNSAVSSKAGSAAARVAGSRFLASPKTAATVEKVVKIGSELAIDSALVKTMADAGMTQEDLALFTAGNVAGSVLQKIGAPTLKSLKPYWREIKSLRQTYVATGLSSDVASAATVKAQNTLLSKITQKHGIDVANKVLELISAK